jgi:hypothetical protein
MHFTNLGAWCCILFEVAAADLIECLREKAAEASLPTLLESQLKSPLGGSPHDGAVQTEMWGCTTIEEYGLGER